MRYAVALLLLCAALLAVPWLPSRAADPGALQGTIVNGTPGGGSVGGLAVDLHTFQVESAGEEPVEGETLRATADAQGRFRFDDLPTTPDRFYQLTTVYDGVVYTSRGLQFEPDKTKVVVELPVYETTMDPAGIVVGRAHLLVSATDTGIAVTELYLLQNPGDRTYIGQQQVDGRRWTSSYRLPGGARDVLFEDGAWGGRFLPTESGLVDTEPLWPGQTTVILAYRLDCPVGPCDLSRVLQQPISNLNVLVPDAGLAVSSALLAQQEALDVQGKRYLSFAASDLPSGAILDLRVTMGPDTTAPAARSDAGWPWIILGTLGAVAYLGYPFWRRHVQEQALGASSPAPARAGSAPGPEEPS